MNDSDLLREEVAQQLAALCAQGGLLHTDAPGNTAERYRFDSRNRGRFLRSVRKRYLGLQDPPREGRSAIVTAGVPGAGKSTVLAERIPDLGHYRVLDADIVKVYLVEQALADGIYDDLLGRSLADGHNVAPMELAALVHRESTAVIEGIRRHCLRRRENIVIEGTLSYPGYEQTVFDQLADSDYTQLQVLGLEVTAETAHRQATSRWWSGREQWKRGDHDLGGRFTPPAAIDTAYDPGEQLTRCSRHALRIYELAQHGAIDTVDVLILRTDPSTGPVVLHERKYKSQG
ncbi:MULTISPECIES: zeta toxin family protein [Nocardiaceae]|uniref:zeta toxin family protein n=1 Tax=Nocardiaceae TaxID=85025 RepID=UPI00070DB4BA|nr:MULTISPECIES: zeta toxin family protein [Rhodococcus]KQU32808.1 hypothetical protein ASH04_12010 [Rhodococcus sp. Leaf233]MDJ0408916.1 zeta toxin family protein [Rhodococcus fascians]